MKGRGEVPPSGTMIGPGGTEAASRVADVLTMFLAGERSLGVSTISRELRLSKAVVHRILQSLVSRGFLVADSRQSGYRLGAAAMALGVRALRQLDVRRVAEPELEDLRTVTRETATLSHVVGDQRSYILQLLSPQEIHMSVDMGELYPLHAGSSGKAILAFLPTQDQERILHQALDGLTSNTITDAAELRQELQRIAANGYAISRGERLPDAASVAAPIFDFDGRAIGSLSVCGPIQRFDTSTAQRYGTLVREAAARVSEAVGYPGKRVEDAGG